MTNSQQTKLMQAAYMIDREETSVSGLHSTNSIQAQIG